MLVILVLGIFSIARLFPGGFFAVRSAENNTFADRLAQAQLETLKQNNAFLLDAVYMYSDAAGFVPTVGPDDLTGTTANPYVTPGGTADATLNDINKARFIQGETFTIPSANTAADNNGVAIHALNYGPVQLPLQALQPVPPGTPPAVAGLPPIHSAPWVATAGNSQQIVAPVATDTTNTYNVPGGYETPTDLYTPGQPTYAIDYTGQRIAVPPAPYPQYFTLVIKRQVTAPGGATSAVTFYYPLLLPASDNTGTNSAGAYDGGWFDPTTQYAGPGMPNGVTMTDVPLGANTPAAWLAGTATLDRTLSPETPAATHVLADTLTALKNDADPYKYVLLNPDTTLTTVSLGVLAFNPRLSGRQVVVSYLAYDWHIIHEDADVAGHRRHPDPADPQPSQAGGGRVKRPDGLQRPVPQRRRLQRLRHRPAGHRHRRHARLERGGRRQCL